MEQIANLETQLPPLTVSEILNKLEDSNFVRQLPDESFILQTDLRYCSLAEFYKNLPWKLPDAKTIHSLQKDEPNGVFHPLTGVLGGAEGAIAGSLDVSMESVLEERSDREIKQERFSQPS